MLRRSFSQPENELDSIHKDHHVKKKPYRRYSANPIIQQHVHITRMDNESSFKLESMKEDMTLDEMMSSDYIYVQNNARHSQDKSFCCYCPLNWLVCVFGGKQPT
jgi:hypothetical protein